MSNKIGKTLLISGSILAASALITIGLKKIVDSIDTLKEGEAEEKPRKQKYFTIKCYEPSKDSTISSIKSAVSSDTTELDE